MMHIEQNLSNENEQVLAVFDGLLPMVCCSSISVVLCSYSMFCIYWCMFSEHVSVVFPLIFIFFQEFEGDFKQNISSLFNPNDVEGNGTIRVTMVDQWMARLFFYSRLFLCILSVFAFLMYCTPHDSVWLPSFSRRGSKRRYRLRQAKTRAGAVILPAVKQ